MDSIEPICDRWEKILIKYGEQIIALQAQIRELRETLEVEKAPRTGGFFARMKARIGDGVETFKQNRKIRDLESELEAYTDKLREEGVNFYNRMLGVAFTDPALAGGKTEFDELGQVARSFAGVEGAIDAAIRKAASAAKAQSDAYAIKDAAAAASAHSKTEAAISAMAGVARRLREAVGAAPQGDSHRIADGLGGLTELSKNAMCFNLGGGGAWLNHEAASKLRAACDELRQVKGRLAGVAADMAARRGEIATATMAAASEADPDFAEMLVAVRHWLPPGNVRLD